MHCNSANTCICDGVAHIWFCPDLHRNQHSCPQLRKVWMRPGVAYNIYGTGVGQDGACGQTRTCFQVEWSMSMCHSYAHNRSSCRELHKIQLCVRSDRKSATVPVLRDIWIRVGVAHDRHQHWPELYSVWMLVRVAYHIYLRRSCTPYEYEEGGGAHKSAFVQELHTVSICFRL